MGSGCKGNAGLSAKRSGADSQASEYWNDHSLAGYTGSRDYTRFTGPQIRKFFETEPAAYADTARIHLVSSFLASRLIGSHAPLEFLYTLFVGSSA